MTWWQKLLAVLAWWLGRRAGRQEQAAADRALTQRVLEEERKASGTSPLTLADLAARGDRGEL